MQIKTSKTTVRIPSLYARYEDVSIPDRSVAAIIKFTFNTYGPTVNMVLITLRNLNLAADFAKPLIRLAMVRFPVSMEGSVFHHAMCVLWWPGRALLQSDSF